MESEPGLTGKRKKRDSVGRGGAPPSPQGTYQYLTGPGPMAGCACPFEQEMPPEKESKGFPGHVQAALSSPAPSLPQHPTLLHGWRHQSEAKGSPSPWLRNGPRSPTHLRCSLHCPLLSFPAPLPHAVPSTWMPFPALLSQAAALPRQGPAPTLLPPESPLTTESVSLSHTPVTAPGCPFHGPDETADTMIYSVPELGVGPDALCGLGKEGGEGGRQAQDPPPGSRRREAEGKLQ